MATIGLLLIAASGERRLKAQLALQLLTALKVPICRLLLPIPVALDGRRLEAPESWLLLNTTAGQLNTNAGLLNATAGLKSVHAVLLAAPAVAKTLILLA